MCKSLSSRPLVGVTTEIAHAQWNEWSRPAAVLATTYLEAVEKAGGIPVLLPPQGRGAAEVAAALDALIVVGGSDVAPWLYGACMHPATHLPTPSRDAWEVALISAALSADLPIVGICRGMQLLNVVRGGSLVQHLPEVVGNHAHAPGPGLLGKHQVHLAPTALLHTVLGDTFDVSTYHHQAVGGLGTGVEPVGWADDGTIEAIELPASRFAVGIQGHPEEDGDLRVFTALIDAARASAMSPWQNSVQLEMSNV